MKSHPFARRRALAIAILDSGTTQRQIAARAGMESSRLSRIVHGLRTPDAQERVALALALARHPDELFPAGTPPGRPYRPRPCRRRLPAGEDVHAQTD